MNSEKKFSAAYSNDTVFPRSIAECLSKLDLSIDPSLIFVFFTEQSDEELLLGIQKISARFPNCPIAGCGAVGTICNDLELEENPSVVMWAAAFPGQTIEVTHLQFERTKEGIAFSGFPSSLDATTGDGSSPSPLLIALADPFTFPMDLFLARLNDEHFGLKVVGGMASAANVPGQNRLICNGQIVNHGAVFAIIPGLIEHRVVVSQGCRPIGTPFVITKAERNQIFELGGKPAISQFVEIYHQLPTNEQRMIQSGLQLGLAVNEYRETFDYGDFLIRNVMRIDENEGAITVGEYVRVGQTVQFHLRDHQSADSDWRQLLRSLKSEIGSRHGGGGLLFSCNGRGINLFENPHHDAMNVQAILGPTALAGFFAAGEVGPVENRNFVHGFTASLVWFAS